MTFKKNPYVFLCLMMAFLIFGFQNCSKFQTGEGSSAPNAQLSGNGGTYDGKPLIYHNYVDQFQCEGRSQPESILVQKNNRDWFLTKNIPTKCAVINQAPVTGVSFDPVQKVVRYQGKTYIPPKPYFVLASESADLPDSNLLDGVCEDANGKCSLRAAIEQASSVTSTSDVVVNVAKGTYPLTKTLLMQFGSLDSTFTIRGEDKLTTALDGQNLSDILKISGGTVGHVILENLSFLNGNNSTPQQGSAITTGQFISVNVTNCLFKGNSNSPAFFGFLGTGDIAVRQSEFNNNADIGLEIMGGSNLLIEDTTIANGTSHGLMVDLASHVMMRRTTIASNAGLGIYLRNCDRCLLENLTIFGNQKDGLQIGSQSNNEPAMDATVNNSTLYGNGTVSGGNLVLFYADPANHLILNNSILAIRNTSKSNCSWVAGQSHNIIATNSIFDDASCLQQGVGNITADPMLSTMAMNGGLTPTLLPLTGSPAIDAGDNLTCAATDQRSLPRPVDKLGTGPRCDIGSVEVQ